MLRSSREARLCRPFRNRWNASERVSLGSRLPIFDIKVKAQKQSAFTKLSQNELAKEFYRLGFFEPSRAEQTLACLDMMEFEGKQLVAEKIGEKNIFANNYAEMQSKIVELASLLEKDHPELKGLAEGYALKYSQQNNAVNANISKGYKNTKKAVKRLKKIFIYDKINTV